MMPFWSPKPATSKVQTLPPPPSVAVDLLLRPSPMRRSLRHPINFRRRSLQAGNPPCLASSNLPNFPLRRWKPLIAVRSLETTSTA